MLDQSSVKGRLNPRSRLERGVQGKRRHRMMLDTPQRDYSVFLRGQRRLTWDGEVVVRGGRGFSLWILQLSAADCSQCPSVCLSVVSVSPLSLSLFISHCAPDLVYSCPALAVFLLTSWLILSDLRYLNAPPFVFEMNTLISQVSFSGSRFSPKKVPFKCHLITRNTC